ncbi:F-box domain-containing protein [Mycena sanguinolenta]|uniref:F-box domain-containing protein n=1 Tax=Mycena sanguinolenta TaxID=230812 RepID=A0A8H6YZU8_9AGAR|nr:F-box domain-containing protein [Mycena sanguinolenta]
MSAPRTSIAWFFFLVTPWVKRWFTQICHLQRLPAPPPESPALASAAQDCNEDTLRLIFEHCSSSTLAAAGRVCRAWTLPAQQELFSALPTRTPCDGTVQWEALSRVLLNSARLRSYIRKVQIFPCALDDLEYYRWIPLLPPNGVLSLELLAFPNKALHAALGTMLLASPEFAVLQRLIITGLVLNDSAVLQRCLEMPSLEHLGIIFVGSFPDSLVSLRPSTTLTRLSIRTWDVPADIGALLRACGPRLRRFDLALTHSPDPCGYARLGAALRDGPPLEHIYFDWTEPLPMPFLDGLAIPSLRHLRAGAGLYTAAFFSNLPPALETLHLEYDLTHDEGAHLHTDVAPGRAYFPTEAAAAGLSAHPTLRLFMLSPTKCCPAMDFSELATGSKSCQVAVLDRAQAEDSGLFRQ